MFKINKASFDVEQWLLFDHTIFWVPRILFLSKNTDWPAAVSLSSNTVHAVSTQLYFQAGTTGQCDFSSELPQQGSLVVLAGHRAGTSRSPSPCGMAITRYRPCCKSSLGERARFVPWRPHSISARALRGVCAAGSRRAGPRPAWCSILSRGSGGKACACRSQTLSFPALSCGKKEYFLFPEQMLYAVKELRHVGEGGKVVGIDGQKLPEEKSKFKHPEGWLEPS